MSSEWIFEGNGYSTEWGVRQAYLASMHKEVPEVDGNPFVFWKKFNVTYIENYKDPHPISDWLENTERPPLKCQKIAEIKRKRDESIRDIIVNVDGMLFNGDDVSQARLCHTIQAYAQDNIDPNEIKVQWVLASNSVETVSIRQLQDALKLAVEEQSRIWVEAREDIIDIG